MTDDAPPPKRVKHPVKAARGRRGGRPPKYERSVPPPELAIPPKRKGGDGGTGPNSPEVRFPCDPVRWAEFCRAYGRLCGKIKPAADAAGLSRQTVDDWFRWASEGREFYRTEVGKAFAELGLVSTRVGENLAVKAPLEWLQRAHPKDFPRERQGLDVTSGGESLSAALRGFADGDGDDAV